MKKGLPLLLLLAGCGGGGGTSPGPAGRAKWTILVYMNAANDLSPFDAINVDQMEQVASNPDVRVVVQWKQAAGSWDTNPSFEGTRRYLVVSNTTAGMGSRLVQDLGAGVDMGDPSTLREFLRWGRANYSSDRLAVVVWNHGNGWRRTAQTIPDGRGVSYDDATGNAIMTWDLPAALGDGTVDLLAWDSSLMQMVELGYELRGKTALMVGSQESPPGSGYPYQRVLAPFRDNPDAATAILARGFVDGMLAEPTYASRKITQSVVDTTKLPAVATALNGLAARLMEDRESLIPAIRAARTAAQSYSDNFDRTYRDAIDLMDELDAAAPPEAAELRLRTAAVRDAVRAAVLYERHNDRSPGSHGLAIDFSTGTSFVASSKQADYARMALGRDTAWDEFLAVAP